MKHIIHTTNTYTICTNDTQKEHGIWTLSKGGNNTHNRKMNVCRFFDMHFVNGRVQSNRGEMKPRPLCIYIHIFFELYIINRYLRMREIIVPVENLPSTLRGSGWISNGKSTCCAYERVLLNLSLVLILTLSPSGIYTTHIILFHKTYTPNNPYNTYIHEQSIYNVLLCIISTLCCLCGFYAL